MDPFDPKADRHASALHRLTRELRVPVEEFIGEPSDSDTGEFLVLVQLWSKIEDSEGRRRLLNIAHQEAERGGYKGCA